MFYQQRMVQPRSRALRLLLVTLLAALLTACGPGSEQARSSGTQTPSSSAPAAAVQVKGTNLPGRLLFARNGDLWVWQGDTGSQLTQRGDLSQPTWSPDGRRIACVKRGPSFSDILLLSANGSDELAITSGDSKAPPNSFQRARDTTWSFYPAFAPDGRTIAYASQAGPAVGDPASDYNLTLYTHPAEAGGKREQIYASDTGHVGRVAYRADGSLAFAFAPTADQVPAILTYRDGQVIPVDGMPEQSYDPAFSADGAWLLFAARQGGSDIFVIPAGGGTPTRLTTLGSARSPAMSPDGKWLAFLALTPAGSSFDLWIAPLTTTANGMQAGEPRALTKGMQLDADSGLSWGG